jgi:hypothetical protein
MNPEDLFPSSEPQPVFIDRSGLRISHAKWKQLIDTPSYCMVREYDNGDQRAQIEWTGIEGQVYKVTYGKSRWLQFDREFVLFDEPQGAVNIWEDWLAENTDCEFVTDEHGKSRLLIVGNRLDKRPMQESPSTSELRETAEALYKSPEYGSW